MEGCSMSGHLGSDNWTCFGGGRGSGRTCGRGELLLCLGLGLGLGVTERGGFCDLGDSFISSCCCCLETLLLGEELPTVPLLPRFLRLVFFLVYDDSKTPFLASIFLILCFDSFFTFIFEGSKLNVESSRWSTNSFLRSWKSVVGKY